MDIFLALKNYIYMGTDGTSKSTKQTIEILLSCLPSMPSLWKSCFGVVFPRKVYLPDPLRKLLKYCFLGSLQCPLCGSQGWVLVTSTVRGYPGWGGLELVRRRLSHTDKLTWEGQRVSIPLNQIVFYNQDVTDWGLCSGWICAYPLLGGRKVGLIFPLSLHFSQ